MFCHLMKFTFSSFFILIFFPQFIFACSHQPWEQIFTLNIIDSCLVSVFFSQSFFFSILVFSFAIVFILIEYGSVFPSSKEAYNSNLHLLLISPLRNFDSFFIYILFNAFLIIKCQMLYSFTLFTLVFSSFLPMLELILDFHILLTFFHIKIV